MNLKPKNLSSTTANMPRSQSLGTADTARDLSFRPFFVGTQWVIKQKHVSSCCSAVFAVPAVVNCFFKMNAPMPIAHQQQANASLRRGLGWMAVTLFLALPVHAKEAAPLAQDEATEKRLVAISSELRCLVCQNESLSGSHADLANDLRLEIRTQIQTGKSDSEIMDFMVSRYGDFVRYRPPLKGTTLLLWFGPGLLFVGGLGGLALYLRRRNKAIADSPLTAEEQRQAERLLHVEDRQQ